MTDQSKVKKLDALQLIREKIGGAFGSADFIFNSHEYDEDTSKDLREIAFENSISLDEIREIALRYLFDNDCTFDLIKEQIAELEEYFKEQIN